MNDSNVILIAQVEQEFEAASAVAALSDSGISAFYKQTASDSMLGMPGALGCPDSFDIFIPEDSAERAKDILISIGCISISEEADAESESDVCDDSKTSANDTENTPQTLNDLMPDNPVLAAVYKVIFAILALIFIAGFVWLSDIVIAWVINLFS